MRLRVVGLLCAALLAGCRDSPREVMQSATEAAARRDLVALQESFSAATVQRLQRAWNQDQVPPADGWQALAEQLLFLGKALEVKDEEIRGDYAKVTTLAGVEPRDYYLRKEDGRWRLEIGAGQRFEQAAPASAPAEPPPPESKGGT